MSIASSPPTSSPVRMMLRAEDVSPSSGGLASVPKTVVFPMIVCVLEELPFQTRLPS
ncbi:MAG: hypothetical protein IJL17_11875 [Kiritimatiellae bacterium]|nr:hypothetical protein [Kiritimatiellia bacterium]